MTTKRVDAAVKTVGDDNAYPGEFEVILSAPTIDRDNEVVTAGCFNPLPDHVTFDIDHSLDVAGTVGSGRPFYDGDLLKVRGTFARTDLAQTVRTLVADGHIRTTSVAMTRPQKETKDGVTQIVKAELLNGSFVSIPSCREALVVAAKAGKAGARNSAQDQALVQEIHDEAVEAGATCPTPAGADPMTTTAAQTIHDLAAELGATCGGAGEPAVGLRDVALRLWREETTMGAAEDDLAVRAASLRIRAMAAIARAVDAGHPADTTVEVNGVPVTRRLRDAMVAATANRPKFLPPMKGAGEVTIAPGIMGRAFIEPTVDPESTGAVAPSFDPSASITIPSEGSIAVEYDALGNIVNMATTDRWAPYWADTDEE